MKNAVHVAVHVSKNDSQVTTVIQPRNAFGQFTKPSPKNAKSAFSFHTTYNGVVGSKGRVS